MSATGGLGGRLALADPGALTPAQRDLFERIRFHRVALGPGQRLRSDHPRLIGPSNPSLPLDEQVRQVVMLTDNVYGHAEQSFGSAGVSTSPC